MACTRLIYENMYDGMALDAEAHDERRLSDG